MIAIFDYGAGNLRSVQNTLDEIGASYELVRDPAGLERASFHLGAGTLYLVAQSAGAPL